MGMVYVNVRRTDTGHSELNKWHMDNLITHIAALTLYIDNYRTDTHDIREDLGLDNKVYVLPLTFHNP